MNRISAAHLGTMLWCRALTAALLLWIGPSAACKGQPMAKGRIDPQTAEAMTAAFNAGMAAFERREWRTAITEMEKVISLFEKYPDRSAMAEAKDRLAPVYYTVGAAAFNLPDYPKSIASFERFVSQFPNHEKAPHARLAAARATFLAKDFAKAAQLFAEMEKFPSLREQSLVIQAQCFKESGRTDEMAAAVEKLIADGITSTARAGAALMLAQARFKAGDSDRLAPLLEQLVARRQFVENVVELNSLIVGLGDSQAEKEQYEKASRTYLMVMPPAQVIGFQKERIASLERRIAANKANAGRNPQAEVALAGQNSELQPVLDQARALLAEFEKLPDYMPALMLRNARCWYGRDLKWESILVNERLMELYPDAAREREAALFSNVLAHADLLRFDTCRKLCGQYLREFPKGANADTVAYVQGAVALQGGDVRGAADLFGKLIHSHPDGAFIDQTYLMLASAHFSLGELDEALATYKRYIGRFPKGPAIEEARYRAAIIPVFQGKYEEGWKSIEAFLRDHPASAFAEDAEYRLMICKYAANLHDQVLADVVKWRKNHPGGTMEPEVLSLKGDCLAAQSKNSEAAAAYMAAASADAPDEVLQYALNEASKLLQKLGDMGRLSAMWEDFIAQRPDHPSVVAGIYWIGRAKTREGRIDEAKEITVTQLKRCLNNPRNESVEMLLQQLAQLCWKRPRPKTPPPAAEAPPPDPDGAVAPPPPPWDAMAELEKHLGPLEAVADESGRPRLDYARVELCKLLKNQQRADELMGGISTTRPDVLSPQLLALSGEFLQNRKRDAEAAVFYHFLKDNFLRSAWLDYAYAGLGAMALAKGDAKTALRLYTVAANEYPGGKLKESTLGLATALMENGQFPEARKLFEQVAGTREWRGEYTAQAVFCLGLVEERQGRLAEAVAHYQRVFVAYQKYAAWVGKAYIKAALCFDKLGKRNEAAAHLREALRNDKLDYDVKSEARELLQQWGVES